MASYRTAAAGERILQMLATERASKRSKQAVWEQVGVPMVLNMREKEKDRRNAILMEMMRTERENAKNEAIDAYNRWKVQQDNDRAIRIAKISAESKNPPPPTDVDVTTSDEAANIFDQAISQYKPDKKQTELLADYRDRQTKINKWLSATPDLKDLLAIGNETYAKLKAIDDELENQADNTWSALSIFAPSLKNKVITDEDRLNAYSNILLSDSNVAASAAQDSALYANMLKNRDPFIAIATGKTEAETTAAAANYFAPVQTAPETTAQNQDDLIISTLKELRASQQ